MKYYFAYGSNLDQERMNERMECGRPISKGKYKIIGPATKTGYKLVFNKINDKPDAGYANIVEDSEFTVEGILYEIDENGIKRLDICEGVSTGHYYKKENFEIKTINGNFKALVYIAQPKMIKEGLKPSKEYKSHLLAGKKFLSPGYIRFLESIETVD